MAEGICWMCGKFLKGDGSNNIPFRCRKCANFKDVSLARISTFVLLYCYLKRKSFRDWNDIFKETHSPAYKDSILCGFRNYTILGKKDIVEKWRISAEKTGFNTRRLFP